MANKTIREAIRNSGFYQWQIADEMGISDITLSRWLRKELPQDKQREVFEAIDRLRKAKEV